MYLLNGKFSAHFSIPTGWTHIVLNYIGPNNGEGIRGYYNGQEVMSDTDKDGGSYPDGDGRIVVGKTYTDLDQLYPSMLINELIFFNKALSPNDIKLLYNAA